MPVHVQASVLFRRAILALALAPAILPTLASAQTSNRAIQLVKSTVEQLVAIINAPGNAIDKKLQLRRVIDSTVSVDEIGRFSLGRFWQSATPDQKKQYEALFRDMLLNNIIGHLGEYQGVSVSMVSSQDRTDGEHVMTRLMRPNNKGMNVVWVVANGSSGPKIIDVIAEGTSLRLIQRSDFYAYLARHNNNIQALINAMQQKFAQNWWFNSVEGLFATLTKRRLKHGVSVIELNQGIRDYLDAHHADPKLSRWNAPADTIIGKNQCWKRLLESLH